MDTIALPKRKHPRLKYYNYSQNGAYFITFCVKDMQCILGSVVGRGLPDAPRIQLSNYGAILRDTIEYFDQHNTQIEIDKYVIMPNHVHLIMIVDGGGGGASGMPRPTNAVIPKAISSLKRYANRQAGFSMWQASYFDRVIRNEKDYLRVWKYIEENPIRWQEDKFFAENLSREDMTENKVCQKEGEP